MKFMWFVFLLLLSAFPALSQDHMALRLNEKGIMKILRMAVDYNAAAKGGRSFIIPRNLYKFTIPKAQLVSNPIIPIVNEISDLNLSKDFDFYLNTSEISITGEVDEKSLKAQIFNSSESGFDVRVSLNLPVVAAEAPKLSLCEDRNKNTKTCGDGLQVSLHQLRIKTFGSPISVSMVLRIRTDGKVVRVAVRSVESNLEGKSAPSLDINFKAIDVPRIAIVINGQESELDTSRLKDEILKRKNFLAQKLLSFIADFVASDVAEMLNVYLVNKEIATSFQIFRKDNPVKFDEFVASRDYPVHTFQRPPFHAGVKQSDPMTVMLGQISELIRNAQLGITLGKISTPGDKDIELSGLVNFILNGQTMNVRNTLGNSNRQLPRLDLRNQRGHDINLAISEPLLNGALDVANSTKLFQEIFETISPVKGVSIRSVKLHFQGDKSLVCVVNAQVDLKLLEAKGMRGWVKNRIAAWLERNNNNSVIYFPIEVSVVPVFKSLQGGGTGLDLRVLSPFNYTELPNRFNYPTNVPDMTETVKDGVMEELRTSLEPYTNKTYSVDVTKFLNQSGVVFLPKTISINQGAYLMLNMDIFGIKFNSKNPTLR